MLGLRLRRLGLSSWRCFSTANQDFPYMQDPRLHPHMNETVRMKFPQIQNRYIKNLFGVPLLRKEGKSNYFVLERDDLLWHFFDLETFPLGRAAVKIASVLAGKHRPTSRRGVVNTLDRIVVVNCDNPKLTGKKLLQKKYYQHTGYYLKETPIKARLQTEPERVLIHAVRGMLPRLKIRDKQLQYITQFRGQFHTCEGFPQFAYSPVGDLNQKFGFDSINPQDFEIVDATPDFPKEVIDLTPFRKAEQGVEEVPENYDRILRERVTPKGMLRRERSKIKRLERRYRVYSMR